MAQIGTVQLAGNANAGPAEVELNTLAARRVIRPNDYTYCGSYTTGGIISLVPGATGSPSTVQNATIFCFRNPSANLAAVKKFQMGFQNGLVGSNGYTNPGFPLLLAGFRAVNFVTQYVQEWGTGQNTFVAAAAATQFPPSPLRAKMADSAMDIVGCGNATPAPSLAWAGFLVNPQIIGNQIIIQTTTTISYNPAYPNAVLDTQPIFSQIFPVPPLTGFSGMMTFLDEREGELPLVLGPLDGFIVNFTIAFGGSAPNGGQQGDFPFLCHWDELAPTW